MSTNPATRRVLCVLGLAAGLLFAVLSETSPVAVAASPAPAWMLSAASAPTQMAPGGSGLLVVKATNVGGKSTVGTSSVEVTLPADLVPTKAVLQGLDPVHKSAPFPCVLTTPTISCETSVAIRASDTFWMTVYVTVGATPSTGAVVQAAVTGGGTAGASTAISVPLQGGTPPFGFTALPRAPLLQEDGTPSALAASHPYEQAVDFEFPTHAPTGDLLVAAGHVRDIQIKLPPGLIANPSVSPVLCTESQLEGLASTGCPDASVVGTIDITANTGSGFGVTQYVLYNMVPPPGYPAMLATDLDVLRLSLHILPSVRTDGDYGVTVEVPDIIALSTQPVFGSRSQIWGDPSSPLHNHNRGTCLDAANGEVCPVQPQPTPFWTLPSRCDGNPLITKVSADSWEEPGVFVESPYASADLEGNQVSVSGCNQLKFDPTISAQPTTNLTDSPSGLDIDLHQPQQNDKEGRSTPPLRDARVTLPAGLSVNPSQADGLGACSTEQVGLMTKVGESPIHFDKTPNSCPDAAKLGTVEVTTPLLAEYNSEHKRVDDPQTGAPKLVPLEGSVYLAKPFENPFGSLLALYLAIEDPRTGTVAKLAGEVTPDPQTGQLTTTFSENPELPLEDIRLHLFGGARGALITPPNCATHTTTSDLVPWSAPETADAHPSSSFQTTAMPGGGACPATPAAAPNAPTFAAGTISPQAGAYTPFALKLSRADGSARLTGFDTLLPPGLTGKLAGVGECSEAQIAQATSRSRPEEGILERNQPSCPAASKLGTVNVAAGAGPTPFYTQGSAYLAGPYKSAPLSMVVITPAIAGPFDLGTVVVRAALNVDPESARIHAVSDPFPQILHGIPLDLRSVAVSLDRPGFTLNPTSCDAMAITGSATSAFGLIAPLLQRFQVGGCSALAFGPKLAIKLKGGTGRNAHPALQAVLTTKPGEANLAKTVVALPHSEFLDQSHIRTICTRVQFAAGAGNGAGCPPDAVYGTATAITPLLDNPLEGPVYLRSSSHKLPDLVAALHGQIDVDLVGRIDSVKGGIRSSFETIPDAPVSKFVLSMQGGKKGLLVNSTNLCHKPNRAGVEMDAQNGKVSDTEPVVGNSCGGGGRKAKGKKGRR